MHCKSHTKVEPAKFNSLFAKQSDLTKIFAFRTSVSILALRAEVTM